MSDQLTSSAAPSTIAGPLTYNSIIRLAADTGKCWGPMVSEFLPGQATNEYYPTLADSTIPLMLVGSNNAQGQVCHGDLLKIRTLETGVSNYNYLGAWTTPSLYYYNNSEDYQPQLTWAIYKVGGTAVGAPIQCADRFYFVNQYYADNGAITANGEYLTSTATSNGNYLTFTVQKTPIASGDPLVSGQRLNLFLQDGSVISTGSQSGEYVYPTMGYSAAPMTADNIYKAERELQDGDTIYLKTMEGIAGTSNILSAYSTPALYYYEYQGQDEGHQYWTIKKVDLSRDNIIHFGDAVYLKNQHYSEYLSPKDEHLTTTTGSEFFWYFLPA